MSVRDYVVKAVVSGLRIYHGSVNSIKVVPTDFPDKLEELD